MASACALETEVYDPIADPEWQPAQATGPLWPPLQALPPRFDTPSWVTSPAPERMVIGWRTVGPETAEVELYLAGDEDQIAEGAEPIAVATQGEPALLHHVVFDQLEPGIGYRYRIRLVGGDSQWEGVFVTSGLERWRFVHLAEMHAPTDSIEAQQFGDEIREFRPQVVIESGDMVNTGSNLDHWRGYLHSSRAWISNVILLPAHSNHANGVSGSQHLLDHFALPGNERWYRTRYGNVDIVTLDSTYDGVSPDVATEPDWIRDQMTQVRNADDDTMVIAAWHYPACSSSYSTRSPQRRWVMDNFVSAFVESGGIDLILVGHDKYYERSLIDMDGHSIVHVQSNAGKLAPSTSGNNEPECSSIERYTDRRSIVAGEVTPYSITGQVIDTGGVLLDWFTAPAP